MAENGFNYDHNFKWPSWKYGSIAICSSEVVKNNARVNVFGINYWQLIEGNSIMPAFVETSLMMAIQPKLVQMEKCKKGYVDEKRLHATYSTFLNNPSSFKITRNGVWGDPTKASKKEGKKIISVAVKNLVRSIKELDDLLRM